MLIRIVVEQELGSGQDLFVQVVDDGLDHLGGVAAGLLAIGLDHDVDGRPALSCGDVFRRPQIGFFEVLGEIESCHRGLRKLKWQAGKGSGLP
ncbi:hypothetical protein D3C75_1278840 [compost metagenome]